MVEYNNAVSAAGPRPVTNIAVRIQKFEIFATNGNQLHRPGSVRTVVDREQK